MIDISWGALTLPAALLLDRLLGDPPWLWRLLPHPVVLIGSVINWLEERLNRPAWSPMRRRFAGVLTLVILLAISVSLGGFIEFGLAHLRFGFAAEAVVAAVLLAQKSLVDHVAVVAGALREQGLESGRRAVSLIVGRDVSVLDQAGVSRAAIESAAENFADGVVAPAFWFLLLGLPGLLMFKAVNTADSMIGHRSSRYEAFGWAAARFDDFLNLVPSRLSAILIATAAAVLKGYNGRTALMSALRDAPRHRSPNAGWPEAAAAGALGLALGGPRRYGDSAVDGAWLHEEGRRDAGEPDIGAAIRLIDAAWAVLLGLALVSALGIGR
jgi:adenosylcobinamide-phosphate synthase